MYVLLKFRAVCILVQNWQKYRWTQQAISDTKWCSIVNPSLTHTHRRICGVGQLFLMFCVPSCFRLSDLMISPCPPWSCPSLWSEVKWKSPSRAWLFRPHELYSPWNSPSQNTGVGSCSLIQWIFAIRDQAQVSHIAGGFFTSWARREVQEYWNG